MAAGTVFRVKGVVVDGIVLTVVAGARVAAPVSVKATVEGDGTSRLSSGVNVTDDTPTSVQDLKVISKYFEGQYISEVRDPYLTLDR